MIVLIIWPKGFPSKGRMASDRVAAIFAAPPAVGK
jgi:hypothetical protein